MSSIGNYSLLKIWKESFHYGYLPRSSWHKALLGLVWQPFVLQCVLLILIPMQNRYWEFTPLSHAGVRALDPPELEKVTKCANGVCTTIPTAWKECMILPCSVTSAVELLHWVYRVFLKFLVVPVLLDVLLWQGGLHDTAAYQMWLWAVLIGVVGMIGVDKLFHRFGQWEAKKEA